MTALMHRLWSDEDGQGMAEYGLIIALVAVVVIVALTALGGSLKNIFQSVSDEVAAKAPATTSP